MKKLLIGTVFLSVLTFADQIDQMWGYLYNHIRGCITDEINSQQYPPIAPIANKMDLIAYLKALPYPKGYYVLVKTDYLTSSEVCYLRWKMRNLGYNSHFLAPVNLLLVAIVPREADAIYITNQVKKLLANPKWVLYVPVF